MNINRTELIEAIEFSIPETELGSHSPYSVKEAILNIIRNQPTTEPKLPTVEEIRDKVFALANELAVAGYGNEAVRMHRIRNELESLTKQPE